MRAHRLPRTARIQASGVVTILGAGRASNVAKALSPHVKLAGRTVSIDFDEIRVLECGISFDYFIQCGPRRGGHQPFSHFNVSSTSASFIRAVRSWIVESVNSGN